MKRAGFTMIELIFVIVILGILAAVAVPKLAATRADAEASKMVSNLATCVGDGGGAYLKDGNFSDIHADGVWAATSLTGLTGNTHSVACEDSLECFALTSVDANGTLDVANGTSTTKKCAEAQSLASRNKLIRLNQF